MPLILVPTPIGNMGDITLRALDELRRADLIACEDTRRSGLLLSRYDIKKPLMSYQKFNERSRVDEILSRLAKGERVCVVSDAGTPGMSDPGEIALRAAIDAGYPVDVLPGPTAFVPAVLLSGLAPQPFTFVGFAPESAGERRSFLESLRAHPFTLVFYLSPHKAAAQMADFLAAFGDRPCALVREISKVYQEARRGTLSSVLATIDEGLKGELVLVVAPAPPEEPADSAWQDEALRRRRAGEPVKTLAAELAVKYGTPKNKIKSWLLCQNEENLLQ